jgi:hypothetical protein
LSINSFTNTLCRPESSARGTPQSTVDIVNLKDLTNRPNSNKFQAFSGLNTEILSSIKPKSRNGRPEVNTSDVELSELLGQDKENQHFDIYNKMLQMHEQETPKIGILIFTSIMLILIKKSITTTVRRRV